MISFRRVSRQYGSQVKALDDVSIDFAAGEFAAITGPSGCGKSTLMHLAAGLDRATSGEIFAGDLPLHAAEESALTEYRRRQVGVVFQFFHLMPTMNVLENVSVPLLLAGEKAGRAREKALSLIEQAGLADRATHFPHQLSGGQMQRTAIARALVHDPRIVLADEPTGNLDTRHAGQTMELLQKIASQRGATLIVVTHSEEIAQLASRRVHMRDGKIIQDIP